MSAITVLTDKATEQGTYIIDVSFYDETGTLVTPNAGLTWTLKDRAGNVINGRSSVSITAASTIHVVLSGADLALGSGARDPIRFLTAEGTYNSTLGSNLPLRKKAQFTIDDM